MTNRTPSQSAGLLKSVAVCSLVPALGLALLAGSLASCSSTGETKDEGAYTTTGKPAGKAKGATVGGSVGVYSEVGGSSRSVR